MVKWTSALGVAALLLFSCEKEIEFKGNSAESLLVVNCITESDSLFKVQLQRSRFFLESVNGNYDITSNAVVTLTNVTTGQVYTVSSPGSDGTYDMGVSAIAGNDYSIQVTHPDYKTVSASGHFPAVVPIISVDTSSYVQEMGNYMKANVTWNDPAGDDFYVMKMSLYNTTQNTEIFYLQLASFDLAIDEISSSELGVENFTDQLFFTDELFDGAQKSMEVRFPQSAFGPDEHYKFTLYRCNKETYKYLVSSEKAQFANGDFFSEPVKVFTNIENGYGIFGALASSVFVK